MENLDSIAYIIIVVIFLLIGLIRWILEMSGAIKRREEEREISVEELPEVTRRMLFGEEVPPPTARPAGPHDAGAEGTIIVAKPRQPAPVGRVEPRVATPRVGAPPPPIPGRMSAPPPPPVRPRAAPQVTRAQAAEAPPRRPMPQPESRPIPRVEEGQMARESQPPKPFSPPRRPSAPRRPPRAPMPIPQDVDEGPAPEPVRRHRQAERRPKPQPEFVLFRDMDDLRRAIVLREVLGPPKALQ